MASVNVLSPHLDDAALACWHQIEQPDTQVITLFAGIPATNKQYWWDRLCGLGNAQEAMAIRRAENQAALAGTGASITDLDYLDRQYTSEPRNLSRIADSVESVSDPGSAYLAPTGVGTWGRTHPDHTTARKVGQELQRRGRAVRFYVEIPRALPVYKLDGWLERLDTHAVETALGQSVSLETHKLSPAQQARKRAAVKAYRSQFRAVNALALGALSRRGAYTAEGVIVTDF